MRARIDSLVNWKSGTNTPAQVIAKQMRSAVDDVAKREIPGLSALDSEYAPLKKFLDDTDKLIRNKDGTLKPGAMNTIANLSNKGNELKLAQLEKLQPGIGDTVRALKALEDIRISSGNKVGSYAQAVLFGGGAVAGGIPGAIAMAIITNPVVVKGILMRYGIIKQWTKNTINNVINSIYSKIQKGISLMKGEKKILENAIADEVRIAGKTAGEQIDQRTGSIS